MTIVLDCEAKYMREQNEKRSNPLDENVFTRKLNIYKHETLPVLGYFDKADKIAVVNTDDQAFDSVFDEVLSVLDNRLVPDGADRIQVCIFLFISVILLCFVLNRELKDHANMFTFSRVVRCLDGQQNYEQTNSFQR